MGHQRFRPCHLHAIWLEKALSHCCQAEPVSKTVSVKAGSDEGRDGMLQGGPVAAFVAISNMQCRPSPAGSRLLSGNWEHGLSFHCPVPRTRALHLAQGSGTGHWTTYPSSLGASDTDDDDITLREGPTVVSTQWRSVGGSAPLPSGSRCSP